MIKKQLLQMSKLEATKEMLQIAERDVPFKETVRYPSGYHYEREHRQYGLYMRCAVENEILKVAVFLADVLRFGGRQPTYDLFIDHKNRQFLTYDYGHEKWLKAKLDRIDWPRCVYGAETEWISASDSEIIKRCLSTDSGDYGGIVTYQYGIREEQLLKRHKRQTDPWDEDLAQVPPVPKDWERWVSKVGIPENYIFYHYQKRGVHSGYCTFCDREVPIHAPKYNKMGHCPRCRHPIVFKAVGRFGRLWTKQVYLYLIQRCRDGFVIREFLAERFYTRDTYRMPQVKINEIRRAICGPNAVPLRAYYWGNYKQRCNRWIEGCICGPTFSYYYGYQGGRIYGKTIPSLAKYELAHTGLPEMIKNWDIVDPEQYLAVLREVPLLEKLAKARLPRLTGECVRHYGEFKKRFGGSTATSLTGILGINQQELKRLRNQNGGLRFLDWLRYERAAHTDVPDDVAAWFCKEEITANDLKFIQGKMSPVQICNYLQRQMRENNMKSKEVLTTWADYLSMAKRFGMDTDDAIIYRVRKLKKRHDELARRGAGKDAVLRAGRLLLKFPHVEEIMRSIKPKYEYDGKEYLIRAPACIEDVLREGDKLCHCISNSERYWDRMEKHESYILFLRKAKAPKTPYYTLEVEPNGTVRQIRTYYDRQNEKAVADARVFLRTWQEVVAKRLSEEDRCLAKASKKLREQEFIQMRTDKVVIRTGDLAGKLLVDVLTADLMEAAA